jgi:hypothetical protein
MLRRVLLLGTSQAPLCSARKIPSPRPTSVTTPPLFPRLRHILHRLHSDAVAYKSLDPVIQISCPCLPVERHTYHTLRRPHRVLRNLMISQVVSSALIVVVWPHLFYVCVLIFVFSLPAYDLAVGWCLGAVVYRSVPCLVLPALGGHYRFYSSQSQLTATRESIDKPLHPVLTFVEGSDYCCFLVCLWGLTPDGDVSR